MKSTLILCFALISFSGFGQELIVKTEPLFVIDMTIVNFKFDTVYTSLNNVTNSIKGHKLNLETIDNIRQGQIAFNTDNFESPLKNIKIDARPSLNLELERVMFTGNFINPHRQVLLCFD